WSDRIAASHGRNARRVALRVCTRRAQTTLKCAMLAAISCDRSGCHSGGRLGGRLRPPLKLPLLPLLPHAIHELMTSPALLDFASLTELASRSEAVTVACACNATPTDGWQTLPLSMPEAQLRVAGTLAEHHQDDA